MAELLRLLPPPLPIQRRITVELVDPPKLYEAIQAMKKELNEVYRRHMREIPDMVQCGGNYLPLQTNSRPDPLSTYFHLVNSGDFIRMGRTIARLGGTKQPFKFLHSFTHRTKKERQI